MVSNEQLKLVSRPEYFGVNVSCFKIFYLSQKVCIVKQKTKNEALILVSIIYMQDRLNFAKVTSQKLGKFTDNKIEITISSEKQHVLLPPKTLDV